MLYIPFESYQGQVGGPSTFMHYLHDFLLSESISVANDISNPDITAIFFPISFDRKILKDLKNRGCKVIQRLDGIYYPSKHGDSYLDLNHDIKEIYCDLADHVVFQSHYSQAQCNEKFGEPKAYSIITNGVDNRLFKANTGLDFNKLDSVNFVTTGNFRNKDMLEPLVQALDMLVKQDVPARLKIVGPVAESLIACLDRPYITCLGKQSLAQVADSLQTAHIFLYSHLNPPCPNSVLEAISVGLPVVGFDSGAMSELLFWQKDLLAPVSDEVFQEYHDFKPQLLAEKILSCIDNWANFKQRALQYTNLYSFSRCGAQYQQLFQSML